MWLGFGSYKISTSTLPMNYWTNWIFIQLHCTFHMMASFTQWVYSHIVFPRHMRAILYLPIEPYVPRKMSCPLYVCARWKLPSRNGHHCDLLQIGPFKNQAPRQWHVICRLVLLCDYRLETCRIVRSYRCIILKNKHPENSLYSICSSSPLYIVFISLNNRTVGRN